MEQGKQRSFRLAFWGRRAAETTHTWTAEALQTQYLDRVYAYALRRLCNVAEAEDVAAEVFAAVFAKLSACPAPRENQITHQTASEDDQDAHDPMVAYLFGIARRKVVDALRKRSRSRETELDEVSSPLVSLAKENPEVQLLTSEANHTLWEILYKLKEEYREVLLLKYVDGRSLKEIAAILERTPTQVGSLLQQAREAAQKQGKEYFGK
jgi:RNA polymerase sigma-70 factor, ECF subfamily